MSYTVVIYPAPLHLTNQWNDVPSDWASMVRGNFTSEELAREWARKHLPSGAPHDVRLITE